MTDNDSSNRPFASRLIALVALLVVVLFCAGVVFPIELVIYLSLGWAAFLFETLPKVRPDWLAVLLAVAALAVLAAGLHGFLSWFWAASSSAESPKQKWRVGWTASIVAIVVMSFVAGVSMVGITHELAWLTTSQEPIIGGTFMAARRMQSSNHLKQIGLGIQNYHDTFQALPLGATFDRSGQALHSWQTRLLGFYEGLPTNHWSSRIDWNQPWNAPRNREHFKNSIAFYEMPYPGLPKRDSDGFALSHYAANQHVIGGAATHSFQSISDGLSNTILCGEAAGNYKAWGHPTNWRDPALGINASKDGFGSPLPGGATFVFADGHTAFLTNKTDPKVLRALATPAGGEPTPNY